jgi:transposase
MHVAIGVDSHKSSFAAAMVDEVGRELDRREFRNKDRGHRQALQWARAIGSERTFGIEGSGRYGAGLARFLLSAGEDVLEVPPFLSHRERKKSPAKGKSDLSDATAIGRIVAGGTRTIV